MFKQNLFPLPKDDIYQVGRYRPSDFVEDFKILILYLEKDMNKLPLLIKKCFIQELVKIRPVALEKDTVQFVNVFHNVAIITSICKRASSFIWTKLQLLLPKDALFHVWLKLAERFWRRQKCSKIMTTTTTTRATKPISIRKVYLCLHLRWAKMVKIYQTCDKQALTVMKMYICMKYFCLFF